MKFLYLTAFLCLIASTTVNSMPMDNAKYQRKLANIAAKQAKIDAKKQAAADQEAARRAYAQSLIDAHQEKIAQSQANIARVQQAAAERKVESEAKRVAHEERVQDNNEFIAAKQAQWNAKNQENLGKLADKSIPEPYRRQFHMPSRK